MTTQGFDASAAPSAVNAKRVLEAINGHFVACYIGGPYVAANDWSPELVREYQRAGIKEFLLIYVGQNFDSGNLDSAQGVADARAARYLLSQFGWNRHAFCALDLEEPTTTERLMQSLQYANAWCRQLNAEGHWPGVYGAPSFLTHLQASNSTAAFIWAAAWTDSGYRANASPDELTMRGYLLSHAWPHRRVWQYNGNSEYVNTQIDLNCKNFQLNGPGA